MVGRSGDGRQEFYQPLEGCQKVISGPPKGPKQITASGHPIKVDMVLSQPQFPHLCDVMRDWFRCSLWARQVSNQSS